MRPRQVDRGAGRRAIVHGHCHQEAVIGLDADRKLLERIGLDFEVLDSGCCGLAGSFGFEASKYDISVAIGERRLLPAVREAPADSLILADGFSCRTQIEQLTDRRAMHVAEAIELAIKRVAPRLPPRSTLASARRGDLLRRPLQSERGLDMR
ncbi:MAG TPA: hypothetical protein VLB79_09650 [Solirubrobacterales bacterium]|nr:hypothetical protein [Solirubrobacterales bacterium]